MKKFALAVAAMGSIASVQAHAADYLVSYSASTGAFSGTITTANTPNANGYYLITALTGTKNGASAKLLPIGSLGENDNLIKLTPDYVDSNGFTYSAGGSSYNVYLGLATKYLNECGPSSCGSTNDPRVTNFSIQAVPGAVPEPATWGMMILGFGVAGFAMRRRVRASEVKFSNRIKRIAAGELA